MLTHGDLDKMSKRHIGLSFTMIFADGGILTACLHDNTTDNDETIIHQCNKTNPKKWGLVVAITDKKKSSYWKKVEGQIDLDLKERIDNIQQYIDYLRTFDNQRAVELMLYWIDQKDRLLKRV